MVLLNVHLGNRIAVFYLVTEFTAGGVVEPNYFMRTFRYNMYVDSLDVFRAFMELVFVGLIIYYIYVYIQQVLLDHWLKLTLILS